MILMVGAPDFIGLFQACFDHIIGRRQTYKDGIVAMDLQTFKPLGQFCRRKFSLRTCSTGLYKKVKVRNYRISQFVTTVRLRLIEAFYLETIGVEWISAIFQALRKIVLSFQCLLVSVPFSVMSEVRP